MSVDFAALAMAVVSGVPDVRACLVVSRDGLALGAYPASEEEKALTVWSRMAALGEVERGFVALRDEVWAFCRRGPYAALATAHPSVRAGVLLDSMEQMLLSAEESRVRKEAIRPAQEREAGTLDAIRGPRTSLHPSREESPQLAPVESSATTSLEPSGFSAWVERLRAQATQAEASPTVTEEPSEQPDLVGISDRSDQQESPGDRRGDGDTVRESSLGVDRAALNREFAGLLTEGQDDDEER
jgi:hypothetical protein